MLPLKLTKNLSQKTYEVLQNQIDKVNKKHFFIVLGDFNTRVGPNITASRLHGPHNTDEKNKNETRLVDFCYNNGLEITNTLFPHKRIHQWTWHHPVQKVGHTLDYVLVRHQYRAKVYDTKSSRQTRHISDHNLLLTNLVIKNNNRH